MKKVKTMNQPLLFPIPAVLVGTSDNGKINYSMIGNCGIMSLKPPVIYISSNRLHFTNDGINSTGYFSVNIPSVNMVKEADYCGMVSGRDTDKSHVFDTFYGEIREVPMIRECPVNLLCKVAKTFMLNNMEVFIGDVTETYISEDCLTNGKPDTKKVDPLIYTMDNMYRSIGDIVGTGYNDGSVYIK